MEENFKLNKVTLSDVQKLSQDEFNYFKEIIKQEEERRTQPEFEEIEAIFFDDGSEGWFMTIDDFQKCARNTDNHDDSDLIDVIELIIVHQSGELHITKSKFPKETFHNQMFFSKDNPYQDELNKLEDNED
jgi:hypothetical protein